MKSRRSCGSFTAARPASRSLSSHHSSSDAAHADENTPTRARPENSRTDAERHPRPPRSLDEDRANAHRAHDVQPVPRRAALEVCRDGALPPARRRARRRRRVWRRRPRRSPSRGGRRRGASSRRGRPKASGRSRPFWRWRPRSRRCRRLRTPRRRRGATTTTRRSGRRRRARRPRRRDFLDY